MHCEGLGRRDGVRLSSWICERMNASMAPPGRLIMAKFRPSMRTRREFSAGSLAAFGLVVLVACGGDGPSSPEGSPPADTPALRYQSANFRVHGGTAPETLLREIADRLEAELPRVAAGLDVGLVRPGRAQRGQ